MQKFAKDQTSTAAVALVVMTLPSSRMTLSGGRHLIWPFRRDENWVLYPLVYTASPKSAITATSSELTRIFTYE